MRKQFEAYGRIKEIRTLVGFAFVEYEDHRDARYCAEVPGSMQIHMPLFSSDAVEKLDGARFLGERIIVEPAKVQSDDRPANRDRDRRDRDYRDRDYRDRGERSEVRLARPSGKNRLRIENLNLKDLMRKAGEVTFTDVDRDGYGYVEFSNSADMEEAIKIFDDYDYEGRRLAVKEVKSRDIDDDRGGSRRNRSRSRSPRREDREPRGTSSRNRSSSRSPPVPSRKSRDSSADRRERGSFARDRAQRDQSQERGDRADRADRGRGDHDSGRRRDRDEDDREDRMDDD
ncbi:hypothetical protein HDU82_001406 [Entophlyctis luteolus]|nr:hypothetical protein HDU82_001406 [Entophlyctis luteolus]